MSKKISKKTKTKSNNDISGSNELCKLNPKKFKINSKKGGNTASITKRPHIIQIRKLTENDNIMNLSEPERMAYTKQMSPRSGSENDYDPDMWNNDSNIRNNHNCYTYAMSKIVKGLRSKAQPGYASGYNHIGDNEYDCNAFYKRMKKDNSGSYATKFDDSCIPGFYKVFLALDPGNDYHWWRMDSDGYWSHKPGSTNVVNVDSSGKKITNPYLANRKYDSLNYHKPCFFACVNSDLSRTMDKIYVIRNQNNFGFF